MAKITIVGDAAVITSSLKLADIKKVAKYRPSALILMGGEDGKEPVFRIGATDGDGIINQYGAEFNGETRDAEKLATITLTFSVEGDCDIKEVVADTIGPWVMTLNKLEAQIPGILEEIDAEKEAILANITVC